MIRSALLFAVTLLAHQVSLAQFGGGYAPPATPPAFSEDEITTNTLSVYEIVYGGNATNTATLNANGLKAQSGNNNYWTYDNVGIKHNNTNILYRFGPGFYALNSPNSFPFQVLSDAAGGTDIVNYRTATNLIKSAINEVAKNVVYPLEVSTSVSGEWNIDLVTHSNYPALYYEMVGAVTSVNVIAHSNGISLADITFFSGTNPITWTSSDGNENIRFINGSTPFHSTSHTNIMLLRSQSQLTHAHYIGAVDYQ